VCFVAKIQALSVNRGIFYQHPEKNIHPEKTKYVDIF